MIHDRFDSRLALGLLVAASTAALAVCQAQTPQRANSAPRAPGVTRAIAIEHRDASDPETATDAPRPSSSRRAAAIARQGVRSNSPPQS